MNDELTGDALEDAGRDAGHPRLGDKPWSELSADEKRQALAAEPEPGWSDEQTDPSDNAPGDDDEPAGTFTRLHADLQAGRVTGDSAIRRLVAALAAGETGDDPDAAVYPNEGLDED